MICHAPVDASALRTAVRLAPLLLLVMGVIPAVGAVRSDAAVDHQATVIGTWTGTSLCVGDRPACKNEVVVYRFLEIEGQPGRLTWLADKIIEGKREPMGKLEFVYTAADQSLTCEFTVGRTHGVWAFKVSGDAMTGTLVVLPDKTLARRVSVHRVREDQVPKAPGMDEYGTLAPQRPSSPMRAELAFTAWPEMRLSAIAR